MSEQDLLEAIRINRQAYRKKLAVLRTEIRRLNKAIVTWKRVAELHVERETKLQYKRERDALNAQERAAEPAEEAPVYVPPAQMAQLQEKRTVDLSAAMDWITAANGLVAEPAFRPRCIECLRRPCVCVPRDAAGKPVISKPGIVYGEPTIERDHAPAAAPWEWSATEQGIARIEADVAETGRIWQSDTLDLCRDLRRALTRIATLEAALESSRQQIEAIAVDRRAIVNDLDNQEHWESVRERRRAAQDPQVDLPIVRDAIGTLADKAGACCGDWYEKLALAAYSACDRLEAHIHALDTALTSQRQATDEAMRRAEEARREQVTLKQLLREECEHGETQRLAYVRKADEVEFLRGLLRARDVGAEGCFYCHVGNGELHAAGCPARGEVR